MVTCENFGVSESDSYIHQSERLGYLSVECTLCGSNPPWVNNDLVSEVLAEKMEKQFGHKVSGCKKCSPYFFVTPTPMSKLHGFTSAGTQRKKCTQCRAIFTQPDFKNIDALQRVLSSLLSQKEINVAIKESGLAPRLYYFYLNKLALILSNFSRTNEERVLQCDYLGMHSEGRLMTLNHSRGFYSLLSAEVNSGYILLQTNNLTKLSFPDAFIYKESQNTTVTNIDSENLELILLARYQSNLKRNHFEQLIMGNIKPMVSCNAIYPDKVAYIHFQLLKVMTHNVHSYDHYIEHETVLRSGALMSSIDEIKKGTANIYYFLPFMSEDTPLSGKKLGWWSDIWFSNQIGAFSSLTGKLKTNPRFSLQKGQAIERFFNYFDKHLNKSVNSIKVIDDLSEVYRVLYNYCDLAQQSPPAYLLGLSKQAYQPEALLTTAIKALSTR